MARVRCAANDLGSDTEERSWRRDLYSLPALDVFQEAGD